MEDKQITCHVYIIMDLYFSPVEEALKRFAHHGYFVDPKDLKLRKEQAGYSSYIIAYSDYWVGPKREVRNENINYSF